MKQLHCRGDEVGHAWLDEINEWMLDALLGHPKGAATTSEWAFSGPAGATCSDEPWEYVSPIVVECGGEATGGCAGYCQFVGDCVIENGTVSAVLGPQLAEMASATCGSGIQGVFPFIDAVNLCCLDAVDSEVCGRFCTTVMENTAASQFFETCAPWGP